MSLPKRETGEEQDWAPGGSLATAAHNEGKTVMKHAHLSTRAKHTHPTLPQYSPKWAAAALSGAV